MKTHQNLLIVTWTLDFNNFWYKYFRHKWPSKDHLCSRLTESLFLHYLAKTEHAKYHIFI